MFFPTQITPAVSYTDPYLGIPLLMPGSKPINFFPGNEPGAINLFPDNIYGKRNYAITDPKTGVKFNISGPENKLIELLQQLTQIKQQQQQQQSGNTLGTLEELDTDIFGTDNTSNGISNLQQTQQAQQAPPGTHGYSMIQTPNGLRLQYSHPVGSPSLYYGAGIAILIKYNNSYVVALFHNTSLGAYTTPGGNVEQKDFNGANTLIKTAVRETREESANLFNISDSALYSSSRDNFTRFTFRPGGSQYKLFVICLENMTPQQLQYAYTDNKRRISSFGRGWNETNDLQFFYIDSIRNAQNFDRLAQCADINGNLRYIKRYARDSIIQLLSDRNVLLNRQSRSYTQITDASMNNTTSYVIR